jgi:hypothetical protein
MVVDHHRQSASGGPAILIRASRVNGVARLRARHHGRGLI